jgi:hypothetical protein
MSSISEVLALTKKSILAIEGSNQDFLGNSIGNYQFSSNQWLQIRYQQDSGLFQGLDPITISSNPTLRSQILNQRLDPNIAESAMDLTLALSVGYLESNAVPVTPGALYAGFIFGNDTAKTLFLSNSTDTAGKIINASILNKARGYTVTPEGNYRTVKDLRDLLEKYASCASSNQYSYTSSKQVTSQKGVSSTGTGALEAIVLAGLMKHQGLAANQQIIKNINLLQGSSITGYVCTSMQQINQAILSQTTNAVSTVSLSLQAAIMTRVSTLGSTSLSSLTGAVPASISQLYDDRLQQPVADAMAPLDALLTNTTGWPNFIQQAASLGGLPGVLRQVCDNTVLPTHGNYTGFVHIMLVCNGLNKLTNNIVPVASEAAGQKFGTGPGGIGSNYRNMNDVISYGTTTLTRNLTAAAQEMVDMGTWNMTDLIRLQTPGTVVRQLLNSGLAATMDLYNRLIDIKVPVGDVENPLYDNVLQVLLTSYDDDKTIGSVSSAFNMYKKITNLGQLTDINYMLPTLVKSTGYADFPELGSHLLSLGINRSASFQKLGYVLGQIDPGADLPHLSQLTTPMHTDSSTFLINHYGYGGGVFGELTMADFIGTAAGYVHNDMLPYIIHSNEALMQTSEGQELSTRCSKLLNLILGNYTSGGNFVIPGVGTYSLLYNAVDAVCNHIDQQLTVVAAITGGLGTIITAGEKAHASSYAQVIKENLHMNKMSTSLFQDHGMGAQGLMAFCNQLKTYAQDNGYGQIGDYLEHIATDDLTGDAIRAILKQGRNALLLANLGVDVKKFQLPQSKYYTDPQGFYLQAYTGNLPVTPTNLQDPIIPANVNDVYTEYRNTLLSKAGYDVKIMNKAVADETYMDLLLAQMSTKVKEQAGFGVLKQVIDRNLLTAGNDIMLIDPTGKQLNVATIANGSIKITDRNSLVSILMILANKGIYGNVSTSKSNNPLNTDKMVYGVVEMLEFVTSGNIDQLRQTLLGHNVMDGFLSDIRDLIRGISNTLDTKMDRNDPQVWADAGPASKLQLK